LSQVPDGRLTPRQTGRLTVGRKLTSTPRYLEQISMTLVRERTILTELPPLVGEVGANFEDRRCRVVSASDPHVCILSF
jgi:hypothetical protein